MNGFLLNTPTASPSAPAKAPQILIPFHPDEAWRVKQAAAFAGRSEATLRAWASLHDIGRRVASGSWRFSKAALSMFMDGDKAALAAYLAGDRSSDGLVAEYFARHGLSHLLGKKG
jgi:hypothetical protein